jgi:hypothetical protein
VGGRSQVLERVASLLPLDVPVVGAIDLDVMAEPPGAAVSAAIAVWSTADLEGAFLAEKACLERLMDQGLIKPDYADVEMLSALVRRLALEQEQNVVAEIAQRVLRDKASDDWPSPRGARLVERLIEYVESRPSLSQKDAQDALAQAQSQWDAHIDSPLALVRGKRIIGKFAREATRLTGESSLLDVLSRGASAVPVALREFEQLIEAKLGSRD